VTVDWGTIDQVADDVIVTVGIAILIVRQFIWRSAELRRMLRLPAIIMAVGLGYLVIELWGGFRWVPGDWLIAGELALVALTGTAMGRVTRFRTDQGGLQYKLTTPGLALWAVFIGIRVGMFYLAGALGANLTDQTGLILLSFGVNRLAAAVVVRRRARRLLSR
jgi:hypothetical protein